MVTAKTENDRIVYLYRGDVVPEGVSADSLEHLKSLGFVTEDDVAPSTESEGGGIVPNPAIVRDLEERFRPLTDSRADRRAGVAR
jgi:hypothetical protein